MKQLDAAATTGAPRFIHFDSLFSIFFKKIDNVDKFFMILRKIFKEYSQSCANIFVYHH